MYKVLSICLAFSLAMSEITTVKQNTVVALGNLALNETHCQIIGQVDHIFLEKY